jgi:hypothetical protein
MNPLATYTVCMVVYVIVMAALWAEPKIKNQSSNTLSNNNKEQYRA